MKRHYQELADCLLKRFKIPENARAEEISLSTYVDMTEYIMSLSKDV